MAEPCPARDRWKEHLEGTLPADEQAALTEHLDGCAACRRTLETLAGSDSLLDVARQAGEATEPATPALHQVMAQFQTSGMETQAEARAARADALSFLQPSDKPGTLGRLSHYTIQETVGQGGFGIVLKAFDEKLHRVVAIKVLSPAYAANGSARHRFIREARTAAAIKNDHIVAIHGVEDEAQPPYLVMELIDGMSLQDKIDRQGPLSLREILRIGMQMAEGLAAAHKLGLVHRDIKPANILLENGVERVKITDFGLARAVDDASVTQSGTVAGTPMYMSPEQAEGLNVDHRSDLFSLGTVLYTMCAGHPPFRASSTHAVLKRVIDASPRPIREINNEIPGWLCDLIAKLHAKAPEDRFQTAKELAELLGQYLAHLHQPATMPLPTPKFAVRPVPPAAEKEDEVVFPVQLKARDLVDVSLALLLVPLIVGLFWILPGVLIGWLGMQAGLGTRSMVGVGIGGGTAVFFGLFFLLRLGAAQRAVVSRTGIHLIPDVGAPRVIPWDRLRRIEEVTRSEVVRKVWIWPGLPPRGSIMGMSALHQFRIEWDDGCYYFAPAEPEAFVKAVQEYRAQAAQQPSAKADPTPRPRKTRRAIAIAAGLLLALAALTFVLVPGLGRYLSNQTSLKFHANSDQPRLLVTKDGKQVAVLSSAEEVKLPPGMYAFEIQAPAWEKIQGCTVSEYAWNGSWIGNHDLTAHVFEAIGLDDVRPIMPRLKGHNMVLGRGRQIVFGINAFADNKGPPAPPRETPWGSVVDPTGQTKIEEKDGALALTLPPGFHDLHPLPGFNLRAPRILNEVEGDFTIEVRLAELDKLDAKPAGGALFAFAGAGLVIWENDQRLLRFLRGYSPGANKPATLETHWFKEGIIGGLPPGSDAQYLRIQRKGPDLHLWNSRDGQTWQDEQVVRAFVRTPKLRVGVAALSTLDKPMTFRLDNFKLSQKEPGWLQLFNGKDLTEWVDRTFPNTFEVADGILQGKKGPASIITKRKDFRNFHLRMELMGNADTRASLDVCADPFVFKGYNIFLFNAAGNWPPGSIQFQDAAKTLHGLAAGADLTTPDQWYWLDVIAKGEKLQVKINGKIVAETAKVTAGELGGAITLHQLAGNEMLKVRKIEIKELPPEKPPSDQEQLQGKWRLVSAEFQGKAVPVAELRDVDSITFAGQSQTTNYKGKIWKGTFTLNPAAQPKEMDLMSPEYKTVQAIYQLAGDKLTIAQGQPAEARPASFTTTANSTYGVYHYQRQAKDPAQTERVLKRFDQNEYPVDREKVLWKEGAWNVTVPAKSNLTLFRVVNPGQVKNGTWIFRGQAKTGAGKKPLDLSLFASWEKANLVAGSVLGLEPTADWRPWTAKTYTSSGVQPKVMELILKNDSPQAGEVWLKDIELVELDFESIVAPLIPFIW